MPARFLPWFIYSIGAIFYCYEYLLRILPSAMTEHFLQTFQMTGASFGNLLAFYYYAYTPMQLPVGILMDRFDPRTLLIWAALICVFGNYLLTQSHLIEAQAGRFLIGLGSSFSFIGVLKLASLWLPSTRFALVTGFTVSLGMLGAVLGNVGAAKLVSLFGAIPTLSLTVLIGFLIVILFWFALPTVHQANHRAQHQLNYHEFFREVLTLCKNPQMWLFGCVGSLLYLSLSAFAEVWSVPYFMRIYGLSNTQAASLTSLVFLGWAIGGPIIGWLSDRLEKRRLPLMLGSILGGLCFVLLMNNHRSFFLLGILLFLFGFFSAAQVLVFPIARELNHPALSGTAIALTNLLVMLGGALSQPLIGKLLDQFTRYPMMVGNLQHFSIQGFHYALRLIPIAFLIAAVLLLFSKETNTRVILSETPLSSSDS